MNACGVSSEKPTAVEKESPRTAESPQSQPGAAQPQTQPQSQDSVTSQPQTSADSSADANEAKTSNAQVIEPKNPGQANITLEPIPEASSAPTTESDSVTATESDVAKTDASKQVSEEEVTIAKIEPAVSKPSVSDTPIPTSTGPEHFVITVAEKDKRHPKFGEGHEMGFLINGVPGGAVVVERGKSYRFDVVTNPKHDVYISTKAIGWGASPWVKGVDGAYIYQGTMTFTPPDDAPEVLYYSCRNHPSMGGEIHVIEPGENIDIAKLTQASSTAAQATTVKSNQPEVSVAMVNQKLMFADMLVNSTASTRVKDSANEQAIQTQQKAEDLLAQAKGELKSGNNQAAYANAEEALALLKSAARLVPSEQETAALKESYEELLHSIDNFKKSHEESHQRMFKAGGESSAIDYDKKQVAVLMTEAESLAQKKDYVNANKKLERAQAMITTAIQQMLNSQTIVYDLNFESPKEEYEYELKRFGGYEELIPIAVEQKQPNEGTKNLMQSFVEKGQKKRSIAIETAQGGDYPRAVAMLQDATKDIRRALRMVGVMQ
jgi:hypothetical protein